MLNVSKLFRNGVDDCYLNNLDLDQSEKDELREARTIIRDKLRKTLPLILKELVNQEFEVPRFFTQGSWAYKTINAPAQQFQQADLDDGCYLPLSYMQEIKKPSTAAEVFFKAVELSLEPLAKEQGWKLVTDKPTCTRLEISHKAHIDIPLYAIPDEEFDKLNKAASLTMDMAEAYARYESWDQLPTTKVLLAHRNDDWIDSDPRPVKEWFEDQCKLKGEQLRYVVRYLKGFRDQSWSNGGPSSILLMSAAAPIFQQIERRDDLALLEVLRHLPQALRDGVENPVNSNEILTDRLKAGDLENIANRFEDLTSKLSAIVSASDPQTVCNWLRAEFGDRLPNRPDLVTEISPRDTIRQIAPVITATPLVGRTEAG